MLPIALLLEVDVLYWRKAGRNGRKLIALRCFDPRGLAWLPVIRVERKE